MRNVFLASRWLASALAIALFAFAADVKAEGGREKGEGRKNEGNHTNSTNKSGNSGNVKSGTSTAPKTTTNKSTPSPTVKSGTNGAVKNNNKTLSGGNKTVKNNNKTLSGGNKTVTNNNKTLNSVNKATTNNTKVLGGMGSPNFKNKTPGKNGWVAFGKEGFNKNDWHDDFNREHEFHHHGYWKNGIWIAPWVISRHEPWYYLVPTTPIVAGHKWLGVTYQPYDGGGAYVTGVYNGSPAQQVGIEVGDVIVGLDGRDATNLGSAIRASEPIAQVQVLSGRTGELVQGEVNLVVR